MKIQTLMTVGIFLIGSSVSYADTLPINHFDVMQDELWHGSEATPSSTASPAVNVSVNDDAKAHYDVMQDELWHGSEATPSSTSSPAANESVSHYDVMQDEFWHGHGG